jgi:hypothetical protein
MTGHTADRERVWAETQQWLDDIDRDASGVEGESPTTDLGDGDASAAALSAPAHSEEHHGDAEAPGDTSTYGDISAGIDGGPVDLDDELPAEAEAVDPLAERHGDPQPPPNDLSDDVHTDVAATDDTAVCPARYNRSLALGFVAATIVATLAVAGALMAMRGGTPTAAQDPTGRPSTQVSVVAAPSTTAPAAANSDATIPYTATAVGCLPGSTASQSVAGSDSTQAWVCVHGGNIGQYLVLNLGRTMVITAVSITPGWVGADASGADQWQQHRVVTRVQWSFNDSPPTVVPQETGSVHGDAVKPMPDRGVLASRIIMLVQETGRAPADSAPTSSPGPAPGGLLDGVLGPPPGTDQPTPAPTTAVLPSLPDDESRTDPADNTFAVSSIKIFGHPPQ